MKKPGGVIIVLATAVATGAFLWFFSNHNHNNDFTIPVSLAILSVLAFSILTELELTRIAFTVIIGVMIALIIKIIIDWQFDPSSHSLFPFEIVIDSFIILVASLIGVAIGLVYRKFIKRKFFDK
jgi:hypothetical protein